MASLPALAALIDQHDVAGGADAVHGDHRVPRGETGGQGGAAAGSAGEGTKVLYPEGLPYYEVKFSRPELVSLSTPLEIEIRGTDLVKNLRDSGFNDEASRAG
jgi:hypothetical protein